MYDNLTNTWKKGQSKPQPTINLQITALAADFSDHGQPQMKMDASIKPITFPVLADTGCQSCLAGRNLLNSLGLTTKDVIPVKTKMRNASSEHIKLLGAIFLNLTGTDANNRKISTKQMTYITDCTTTFFLSREACADLGIISKTFPMIGDVFQIQPAEVHHLSTATNPTDHTAPCGCPKRTTPPLPPEPPVPATDSNRQILQDFLLNYFGPSTFNTCEHQPLPRMTGPPMKLMIDTNATPVAYHNPYPVPIYLQESTKKGLDKDVQLKVLEPVPDNAPVEWCHRMVVCAKQNGEARRTVDFQALNKYASRETHHTPSPFHLARAVPHHVKKTTCDAKDGYHGVPLTEESCDYTQFITQWGRYRYLVAPQGYIASGDAFTRRYDAITANVKCMIRCIDDTLLWASNTEEAFHQIANYLYLCGKNGIVLNPKKFTFAADEVEFAGFEITMTDVRPCRRFLKAISDFPTPKSITDIRSWFGLVNQSSYAFSTTDTMLPFRALLKSTGSKFEWTPDLDQAFEASKAFITKEIEQGVRIFDKSKPTCLATDWSKSGIGFWLFQKHCKCPHTIPFCCPSGWKITLFGSRFTHSAETRYAPVEGEALAVVYALDKARYFVLGCPNLIIAVDHKPLLKLFGDRNLEDIPNPRLRNLKEKTLRYRFKMIYISGVKHKVADGLSRNPVSPAERIILPDDIAALSLPESTTQPRETDDLITEIEEHTIATAHSIFKASPITSTTWDLIRTATASDTTLHKLMDLIENGFPESRQDTPQDLHIYYSLRENLSTIDGVILYRDRILVPEALRPNVLTNLHAAHQGVSNMLSRAESSTFWPGITKEIQDIRSRCAQCNQNAPSNPSAPPTPPTLPAYPFQCICADFFSQGGTYYLVFVDRYSNWPVVENASEGATGLIASLKDAFTIFGIPEELSSDGGPEFTASLTQAFLRDWGIHHRLSSVAFAHSNCRAELGVKSMKRLLSGNTGPGGSLNNDAFRRAILQYRNTPDRETKMSPAMCLFGQHLRDFVPMHPNKYLPHKAWQDTLDSREDALRKRHMTAHERLSEHTRRLPPLKVGDHVRIQNQTGRFPLKWDKTGVIVEVRQFDQYVVKVDGSNRATLRNRKFLRKFLPARNHPLPRSIISDLQHTNRTHQKPPDNEIESSSSPTPPEDQSIPVPTPSTTENQLPAHPTTSDNEQIPPIVEPPQENQNDMDTPSVPRRSNRTRKPPDYYGEWVKAASEQQ